MKLKEAIPICRATCNTLAEQTRNLTKQRDEAKKQYEITKDQKWADQATSLQLSIESQEAVFNENQKVLEGLVEQHMLAFNAEVTRKMADPENNPGAELAKIMTTVARMCAGDKVPYKDEERVMKYDGDMYMKAKHAQMIMAAMKKKQKEYDSLWEEKEEDKNEYDPQSAADNTEAVGELEYGTECSEYTDLCGEISL